MAETTTDEKLQEAVNTLWKSDPDATRVLAHEINAMRFYHLAESWRELTRALREELAPPPCPENCSWHEYYLDSIRRAGRRLREIARLNERGHNDVVAGDVSEPEQGTA